MIRVFKRIKELLDCPTPDPGKAIGWDAQGNPANLPLTRWYCAANATWYTVSIILDSDSGLPTLDFTPETP